MLLKKLAIFAAALCFGSPCIAQDSDWIQQYIANQSSKFHVPGGAVAVVMDGQIAYAEGFGFADLENQIPATASTVFRVGSNSKPVSASAILILAAELGIGLHDDLRPHMVGLSFKTPPQGPLTLHQLLTHTGGFNEALFGQHSALENAQELRPWLEKHLPPQFIKPGAVIAYSDFNTALAGLIIEHASGQKFEQLAKTRVFEPLSMTSSTFEQVNLPSSILERRARSYRHHNGQFYPYSFDAIATAPAAGLYSTSEDMGRYLEALLASWRAEFLQQGLNAVMRMQLQIQARNHPSLTGRTYGFVERIHNGWKVLQKDGQASGFNARLVVVPEANIGFFVVHNRNILKPGGGFNQSKSLIPDFTDEFLQRNLTSPGRYTETRYERTEPRFSLDAYTGEFRTAIAARHTWEKLVASFDTAVVTANGDTLLQGSNTLTPVGNNLFVDHSTGAIRAFRFDEGKATHMFIGASTYERVPRLETTRITIGLLAGFIIGFAVVVLAGCFHRMRRSFGIAGIAGAACCLTFLTSFGWILIGTDPQTFFIGMPLLLALSLALPIMAFALAFAGVIAAVRNRAMRLSLLPLLLVSLFCLWLTQWNLLGWHII